MGLAGFCANRVFGGSTAMTAEAEFFCAVSRCFRHEISPQESLLYRTHQFTKVHLLHSLSFVLLLILTNTCRPAG